MKHFFENTIVAVGALSLALAACSSDPDSGNKAGAGGAAASGGSMAAGTGGRPTTGTGGSTSGTGGSTAVDARPADAAMAMGSLDASGDAPRATGDGGPSADAAPPFPPVACTGVTSKTTAIEPAAGRKVYCAIDLGSNSAKFQVISLEEGKPLSFKDERQCRTRLGFGAKVFANNMAMPLPAQDIKNLIEVMNEFKAICALDKGTLVGAEATQWARDATNMADVKAMVKTATTLDIDVLTPDQEGIYGYVASTRNSPEKFSLDPGSNSFQLSWWPKGATGPRTFSVPFGYVRGSAAFYDAMTTDTYTVARGKHVADLKMRIDAALKALTPPTDLAALKAAVTAGNIKPEVFIAGQDGALHLAVRGELNPMGKWIDTQAAYDARVAMERPMPNAMFGDLTAILTPADLTKWFTTVTKEAADFSALRTTPIRPIYGEKVLANTVLLDFMMTELGVSTVVLVPQEMPAGYILAKIK